ncbi:MAG: exodeoxyribonuclease V subunit alpha [Burkholderiaceae bacterium]|nr:exodeoxyribonuclease V subunit alpha [Burkholderiaceae bacterium]
MNKPLELLQQWVDAGWLRHLDRALARWVAELDPQARPELLMATALLAHLEGRGHTCLPLEALVREPAALLAWPAPAPQALAQAWHALPQGLDDWLESLRRSPVVHEEGVAPDQGQPLVLGSSAMAPLLYLRRYWGYETRVAQALRERASVPLPVDEALARQWLARLFAPAQPGQVPDAPARTEGDTDVDWQQLACAVALRSRVAVLTGGPGTGKTYTAARLLALLAAMEPPGRPWRVALAAPTGKAAARLRQSIDGALQDLQTPLQGVLDVQALAQRLGPARTLHALLGAQPHTRQMRHHAGHPLDVDVLLVDEASMVHLEMMAALLDALPASARLVLLGDKDQLASVEAGAVLGDLCRDAAAGRYSTETRRYLQATTGQTLPDALLESGAQAPALAQHMVMLRKSRRFGGPIGALALAVNQGDAPQARRVLDADPQGAVHLLVSSDPAAAVQLALRGRLGAVGCYRDYLRAMAVPVPAQEDAHTAWVQGVLRAFDGFRLLCAVREGPWGAAGLNRAVETALRGAGLLQGRGEWYAGRPVMVTRNDAGLGVFNGDIGIVLQAPGGGLRAYFADGPQLRSVGVSRLAHVETAFAMTVHKSQGSEFGHTALVLPPQAAGALLSRELVYTGITRARDAFTLVAAQPAVLEQALRQRTQRSSGLPARLQA